VSKPRVGILPHEERMAIIQGARKLGLDPYEFGAFLSLESGPNMDPNIVGGAGGRHRGLIQFGQNEQRLYGIEGPQTRAGQMPKVMQYFADRGFKPGMGIARAYATVLGGNPNVSLNAKDSFGTSVSGALSRFRKGGDLYANARRVLGDIPQDGGMLAQAPRPPAPAPAQAQPPAPVSSVLSGILGVDLGRSEEKKSLSQMFVQTALQNLLPGGGLIPTLFGAMR
jgi:hypothetical protein